MVVVPEVAGEELEFWMEAEVVGAEIIVEMKSFKNEIISHIEHKI